MAIQSPPETITVPAVHYVKTTEDRTARITILTPKGSSPRLDVSREVRESRDGVFHDATQYGLPVTIEQVMAHPDGPATMANIIQILDDIAAAAAAE
jgi:hypothetical protein